jgi:hypothetical protein
MSRSERFPSPIINPSLDILPLIGQLNILVDFTTISQQQLNKIDMRNNNTDSIASNNSENVSFSIMIQPKDVLNTNSPNTRI